MNFKAFKTSRWLTLCASLGMMLLGYVGFSIFNRPSSTMTPERKEIFTGYDFLCMGFLFVGIIGCLLCMISVCWILIAAAISMLRKWQKK